LKYTVFTLALMVALAGLSSPRLSAATIGPSCGSCYGATYTLSESLLSSTKTTSTYQVTYSINTKGYIYNATDYIQQVAVKISNNVISSSLVSAPLGGNWTLQNGGLNSSGCSGSGAGFICASDGTSAVANGSTYTWVFDIQTNGTIASTEMIKANYNPAAGILMSENIPEDLLPPTGPVPEPTVLSLLVGGIGVWAWSRKRGNTKPPGPSTQPPQVV
jgi:hypothetical protein